MSEENEPNFVPTYVRWIRPIAILLTIALVATVALTYEPAMPKLRRLPFPQLSFELPPAGIRADADWPRLRPEIPAQVPTPIADVSAQLVTVRAMNIDGSAQNETGIVWKDGVVLTTNHGIAPIGGKPADGIVIGCHGRFEMATIIAIDAARDLAALKADCHGPTRRLAAELPPDKATVYVVGLTYSPSGRVARRFAWQAQVDRVSNPYPKDEKEWDKYDERFLDLLRTQSAAGTETMVGITEAIRPGNSGSVVCLANGEVTGFVSAFHQANRRSFMIPPSAVRAFLRQANTSD